MLYGSICKLNKIPNTCQSQYWSPVEHREGFVIWMRQEGKPAGNTSSCLITWMCLCDNLHELNPSAFQYLF